MQREATSARDRGPTGVPPRPVNGPVHKIGRLSRLRALAVAMRPRQWLKNGLAFVALVFTLNLQEVALLERTIAAFLLFCALSSAGYLLNDVADIEADRVHPTKRSRPIASGVVSVSFALGFGVLLAVVGVIGSFLLVPSFGLVALAYLTLTAAYTLWLKHIALLDIFGIAAGFVLRAAGGAVAIAVPMSPWLYVATLLGALLIALGKRRAELQVLGGESAAHRRNLDVYTIEFVDQLILIIASVALMTYSLYTFSAENLPRDRSMMVTIPVVLYGLFRYLLLIRTGGLGGSPEDLLLRDRPLLVAVVLWAILAVGVLYLRGGRIGPI